MLEASIVFAHAPKQHDAPSAAGLYEGIELDAPISGPPSSEPTAEAAKLQDALLASLSQSQGQVSGAAGTIESRPNDTQDRVVKFDLEKPLGIFFDKDVTAKGVQPGSQAEEYGVGAGWRALRVGADSVQTTKEFVTKIKSLKETGQKEVDIAFTLPEGSD